MTRLWRGGSIGGLALLALLAACGRSDAPENDAGDKPVRLSFEDRPEPDVFSLEGPGTRDGPEGPRRALGCGGRPEAPRARPCRQRPQQAEGRRRPVRRTRRDRARDPALRRGRRRPRHRRRTGPGEHNRIASRATA